MLHRQFERVLNHRLLPGAIWQALFNDRRVGPQVPQQRNATPSLIISLNSFGSILWQYRTTLPADTSLMTAFAPATVTSACRSSPKYSAISPHISLVRHLSSIGGNLFRTDTMSPSSKVM
jgi:hypothetical protein